MARPRQFDETQVIENLMKVFWQRGYEAASMQDLVKASGLQKGSLYGAFGDKQALYLTALEHYDRTRIQRGIDLLNGDRSSKKKIAALFDDVIESMRAGIFAGGCLLCNACLEMAAIDTKVKQQTDQTTQRLWRAIVSSLKGDDAESLASTILSAYFGCRVLAKSGAPVEMLIATRDRCLEMLS